VGAWFGCSTTTTMRSAWSLLVITAPLTHL
jgi:hypothetical protein